LSLVQYITAALFTAGLTSLVTWVYKVNARVTTLEAERVNLAHLERLMTTKYDSLEKLIDIKFQHLQELVKALSEHQLAQPRRHLSDE
jgi:prepilin signal peptidase PulO-like enzyme (type II secretory pathway)